MVPKQCTAAGTLPQDGLGAGEGWPWLSPTPRPGPRPLTTQQSFLRDQHAGEGKGLLVVALEPLVHHLWPDRLCVSAGWGPPTSSLGGRGPQRTQHSGLQACSSLPSCSNTLPNWSPASPGARRAWNPSFTSPHRLAASAAPPEPGAVEAGPGRELELVVHLPGLTCFHYSGTRD